MMSLRSAIGHTGQGRLSMNSLAGPGGSDGDVPTPALLVGLRAALSIFLPRLSFFQCFSEWLMRVGEGPPVPSRSWAIWSEQHLNDARLRVTSD
jgi:hypothetical protein